MWLGILWFQWLWSPQPLARVSPTFAASLAQRHLLIGEPPLKLCSNGGRDRSFASPFGICSQAPPMSPPLFDPPSSASKSFRISDEQPGEGHHHVSGERGDKGDEIAEHWFAFICRARCRPARKRASQRPRCGSRSLSAKTYLFLRRFSAFFRRCSRSYRRRSAGFIATGQSRTAAQKVPKIAAAAAIGKYMELPVCVLFALMNSSAPPGMASGGRRRRLGCKVARQPL